jgi:hypothetical protein
MKKSKKLFLLFPVIIFSLLMLPSLSIKASTTSIPMKVLEGQNNVYTINASTVLIKSSDETLELMDITQNKMIKELNIQQKIMDIQLMKNPNKMVVITQTPTNKIQKHVYTYSGNELSKFQYTFNLPTAVKVKWAAPYNGINERIMVESGSMFYLYQADKNKPIAQFDSTIKKDSYEYVNVVDWDFKSYPYLTIKYAGQRTMASDYFIRMINLYTKKATEITHLEVNGSMRINDQKKLELWSSYTYDEVVAPNAGLPDPSQEHSFHSLYSLDTGKVISENKALFQQTAGEPSGWQTQTVGDYVFVQDLSSKVWGIYNSNGGQVAMKQSGLDTTIAKFLTYNTSNQMCYFLTSNSQGELSIKTIKIK